MYDVLPISDTEMRRAMLCRPIVAAIVAAASAATTTEMAISEVEIALAILYRRRAYVRSAPRIARD